MLCNGGDKSEERAKSLVETSQVEGQIVTQFRPLDGLFTPDGEVGHAVVSVDGQLLFNITDEVVSVEPKKIIDDYSKRQIPRFRQVYWMHGIWYFSADFYIYLSSGIKICIKILY